MVDFSDEFLAFLELKQDLFFHKIPPEQIMNYINRSLAIGKQEAAAIQQKNISVLYQESGIGLKVEAHDGVFFKVKLRAQFETNRQGNHLVYLYKQSIDQLAHANDLSFAEMKNIVLAHEYFHYLEEQKPQQVYEGFPAIITGRLLGFTRQAQIRRTSEIAANAFAKQLLGLSCLPSYYDYQYLLQTQQLTLDVLEAEFAELLKVKSLANCCA